MLAGSRVPRRPRCLPKQGRLRAQRAVASSTASGTSEHLRGGESASELSFGAFCLGHGHSWSTPRGVDRRSVPASSASSSRGCAAPCRWRCSGCRASCAARPPCTRNRHGQSARCSFSVRVGARGAPRAGTGFDRIEPIAQPRRVRRNSSRKRRQSCASAMRSACSVSGTACASLLSTGAAGNAQCPAMVFEPSRLDVPLIRRSGELGERSSQAV